MIYGALEAGGTKMVCAIGDENGKIYEQVSIPTLTPDETMPKIIEYFKNEAIETGIPYQTLINLYLGDCVKNNKKLDLHWR